MLDDKIKANQAQHNLDRETAKFSALSSKELDNWIYSMVKLEKYQQDKVMIILQDFY